MIGAEESCESERRYNIYVLDEAGDETNSNSELVALGEI